MFDEDIPEALQTELLAKQAELQQVAKRHGEVEATLSELMASHAAAKGDAQNSNLVWRSITWRAIKAHRAQLATITVELRATQKDLKAILRECHKYEAPISARSNVAGDLTKLRMPVTRSACYPHAARLPTRDDQ